MPKSSSSFAEQMPQNKCPSISSLQPLQTVPLPASCSSSTTPNCYSREHRDLSFPGTPLPKLSLFLH